MRAQHRHHGVEPRRVVDGHDDALAAGTGLELVGRPGRDHGSVVDDDDLVREPVGLVEVLGREQGRRALGHELLDEAPHREAAARVEPSGGLVEEEDRRPADEAHPDVEATPHPPGVGLHDPVARVDEIEPLEQLVGTLACLTDREVEQPADVLEVLEAGEPLVDGRVLAGEPDPRRARRGSATTSMPSIMARPASGCSSVVRMRTAVVLPAPFGPEQAEHRRALDLEVDAAQRLGVAEPLRETFGDDCRHGRSI